MDRLKVFNNTELYEKVSEGAYRDLYVTWDENVQSVLNIYKENIKQKKE